ncbi:hypothetical protein lerEdw1_011439 [Lerista edwardsae]|nr:hypothetical protein lerEdw1_011439 [Lerista edwardsae]
MGSASGIGALLVVMVVGVFPPEVQSARPPEHFVQHRRTECHLPNGTGPGVHYMDRHFWGQQEIVRFDSRRGSFEAVTELGQPIARYWNRDRDLLEQFRAEVDRFCRYNYGSLEPIATARKLKPQLQITPMDTDFSSPHLTLLVCSVDSFFPAEIDVTWLRNGQEEDKGRVSSTGLIRNGDWTFSKQVMLEAQPERGDVYACRVEHASLPEPTSVQWEPQSDSARSKMWTGVVGLLLGLAFAVPGLALHLKSKKGAAVPQPAAGHSLIGAGLLLVPLSCRLVQRVFLRVCDGRCRAARGPPAQPCTELGSPFTGQH